MTKRTSSTCRTSSLESSSTDAISKSGVVAAVSSVSLGSYAEPSFSSSEDDSISGVAYRKGFGAAAR